MRIKLAMLAFLGIAAIGTAAHAHTGAGGNLGVGVGIGAPTALSIEGALTPRQTVEVALGMNMLNTDRGYVHGVYKWAFADLARANTVNVPVYIGGGPYIADFGPNDVYDVGVRIPVGLNFDFRQAPVQIFGELAPELALVQVNHEHDVVGLGGYAGMRYWF
jgi:hypothetical protein